MAEPITIPNDAFVWQLTTHQPQLRGVIMAGLGNYADSQDVLQRTNMTIWKKSAEFDASRPFLGWAIGIAKYEILAFLRDRQRERVVFVPEVAELLVAAAADGAEEAPWRQEALRACLAELPDQGREVLSLKYARGQSIQHISAATGRSVDGVKSFLLRMRKQLAECIERRLARDDAPLPRPT